jgi:hypothetical protein
MLGLVNLDKMFICLALASGSILGWITPASPLPVPVMQRDGREVAGMA